MRQHAIATIAALAAAAFLAGCGGRDAHPVATVQPTDSMLSCELMYAEIAANNERARSLAREKSDAEGENVALGVAGAVLFWPALFFMDLSNAEQVEMDALRARNQYLGTRMVAEDCGETPPLTATDAEEMERQKRIEAAEVAGGPPPKCSDVGGYEAYKRDTGRICALD